MNRQVHEGQVIKERLEEELSSLSFRSQEQVLKRTHPKTLLDKWRKNWNKELEIPLAPATLLLFLLFGISAGGLILVDEHNDSGNLAYQDRRVLVDTGASIYYSDLLEKAVGRK